MMRVIVLAMRLAFLRRRGRLVMGRRVRVGAGVRVTGPARVELGDDVELGAGSRIDAYAPVVLRAGARLGERAAIVARAGVEIGARADIGDWAIVADDAAPEGAKSLRVGDGARVGMHAVVGGDVAAGAEVAPYGVIERNAVPGQELRR
jgi:serine acetyltransferase